MDTASVLSIGLGAVQFYVALRQDKIENSQNLFAFSNQHCSMNRRSYQSGPFPAHCRGCCLQGFWLIEVRTVIRQTTVAEFQKPKVWENLDFFSNYCEKVLTLSEKLL